MRIFLVAYFVVPPQDLVPYAQRVVRVMGVAARGVHMLLYVFRPIYTWRSWNICWLEMQTF